LLQGDWRLAVKGRHEGRFRARCFENRTLEH
jgi:hypothetical protein